MANNIVIDKPNEVETRRGFNFYGIQITGHGTCIKMFSFQGAVILWFSDGSMWQDSDGAGTWTQFTGTFLPPTNGFINTVLANGNLYFTTNNGVYKLDSLSDQPQPSGAPRGVEGTTAITNQSGAFLANNSQVAYRVVWGYIDNNNNTILGTPSGFIYVSNSSGNPAYVTLTLPIPPGGQINSTNWFYQLYRTPNTGSLSITPGDNLQLAAEVNLTSTDLTNGYITAIDNVPDALLGAFLYTDSTQDGESAANDQPPLCYDLCWNSTSNTMLYLNCQTRQTVFITMDSVGSPNGVQVGDTITIEGTTYTAVASGPTAHQFVVVTGGTPASNIDATARNLQLAINLNPPSPTIVAYYTSTATSLPGSIELQAVNFSTGVFYVTASRSTSWLPAIPTSGTTYFSSNSSLPNQVYSSKPSQPEAVPIGNVMPVGSQNFPGYRIFSLRTGALVQKADGVFLLSGSTFPLNIVPVDTTVFIYGPATAVSLNNSVFMFTTQAVTQAAESGVEIQSHVIEDLLLDLSTVPTFPNIAFGVQYESERKYLLFVPNAGNPNYCTQAFVYNWVTQAWVTWERNATAGYVTPKTSSISQGDVLYLARPDGWIVQERKTRTTSDYCDEQYNITITAIGTSTLTVTDTTNISIGDVIQQGNFSTTVTNVNQITDVLTVTTTAGFNTGSAIDFTSYVQEITYQPLNGGWPNAQKRWSSLQFAFADVNFNFVTLTLSSDQFPPEETVILVPKATGQWGTLPWGLGEWGLTTYPSQLINTQTTNNTTINTMLNVTLTLEQAFQNFGLSGVTGNFNIIGDRWF